MAAFGQGLSPLLAQSGRLQQFSIWAHIPTRHTKATPQAPFGVFSSDGDIRNFCRSTELWRKRAAESGQAWVHLIRSQEPKRETLRIGGYFGWIRDAENKFSVKLAEGAGFEPAIRFPAYTLSRR